jgi:PHD/YefM family antitoxin component YafN of YafNO toxin-antitoxin module
MTAHTLFAEPDRVEEPQAVQEYYAVLSQLASARRPLIVRRNGEDLAAVIPLELLELLQEAIAREEVEKRAAQIHWHGLPGTHRPPQAWFDDTDNPFEPTSEPAP